jgi:cytochrome c peroxidase
MRDRIECAYCHAMIEYHYQVFEHVTCQPTAPATPQAVWAQRALGVAKQYLGLAPAPGQDG